MILSKTANVKINGRNIRHFESLGYAVYPGDIISVPIKDMTSGSSVKITARCDYCFMPYMVVYKKYIKEKRDHITKKVSCLSCKGKKAKESLQILYGIENVMQIDSVKNKLKSVFISKYGVENPTMHPEIKKRASEGQKNMSSESKKRRKEKTETTVYSRYGVKSVLQLDKTRKALFKVRASSSSQQTTIYRQLKEIYGDSVVENFYVSKLSLDILLTINSEKIDIEYDSSYWHNPKSDRRRDEYLKSIGYKVLRIKSGKMIPSTESVVAEINRMIGEGLAYSYLVLPDWNEEQYKRGGMRE